MLDPIGTPTPAKGTEPTTDVITVGRLALWLDKSIDALQKMRQRGQGPSWFRIGRSVRYRVADVRSYIDDQMRGKVG